MSQVQPTTKKKVFKYNNNFTNLLATNKFGLVGLGFMAYQPLLVI